MIHLGFTRDEEEFRSQVRRHGYVVTRLVVRADVPKRVWGVGSRKATYEEVQHIDNLLSQEHLSIDHIVRIMRIYGMSELRSVTDLNNALLRSGFAWRYGMISVDREREEIRKEQGLSTTDSTA